MVNTSYYINYGLSNPILHIYNFDPLNYNSKISPSIDKDNSCA